MEVKDNRVWKTMTRSHKNLVDLLLGQGTGRRGIYELILRGGYIIAEEGPEALDASSKDI